MYDGDATMDVAAAAKTDADEVVVPVLPRRTKPDGVADGGKARGDGGGSAVADRGAAVYPPRSVFRPTPRNITVNPGGRAVLKCRVENLGTKTVSLLSVGIYNNVHPLFIIVHEHCQTFFAENITQNEIVSIRC